MNEGVVWQAVLAIVPAVAAITLHEAAHGYAALALGDDTARRMGRLSLNPLRHVDRFGTVILPLLLLVPQLLATGHVGFMFGWAKPVPVDARRMRDPRRAMALVAIAGPAMNLFLAWLAALAMAYGFDRLPPAAQPACAALLGYFMVTNVVLALFNLLPIPPLDGGRIAVGVLPLPVARQWARLERGGLAIVLVILFAVPFAFRQVGLRVDPFRDVMGRLVPATLHGVVWLTGHG